MEKLNTLIIREAYKELKNSLEYHELVPTEVYKWEQIQNLNIEDYDIIFFDCEEKIKCSLKSLDYLKPDPNFNSEQLYFIFATKCNTFWEILTIFSEPEWRAFEDIDMINELWNEIPKSESNHGKKILIINPNHNLSKLLFDMKNYDFYWNWSVIENELPKDSYPLAKNKKGEIISFIWKQESTTIIILPHPYNLIKYINDCLKNLSDIKKELSTQSIYLSLKKPEWLKNYDLFEKAKLIKNKEELEIKINKIEQYEILLYGYGKPLERAINDVFLELGFEIVKRSVDRADLFFETKTTKFIVEIKGLKDIAFERDISQMYKWLADELNNENKSEKQIKLIFICNAQREKPPEKRDIFFDNKVIEIAKTHNWGLISTLDLFHALFKMHNSKLSKDEVISVIETQVGVIKLENFEKQQK